MSKRVLLLGSGFVTGPALSYLSRRAGASVTVGSILEDEAKALVARLNSNSGGGTAAANYRPLDFRPVDAGSRADLERAVPDYDLVISLVPAAFHAGIAEVCIDKGVNMVTSSYVSEEMQALDAAASDAGIVILNETGLDPGIDHLGAMEVIDEVHAAGGTIRGFTSWCGGLPTPEACDNPLGYKFSWSPRGVLSASLNSATFREGGEVRSIERGGLFRAARDLGDLHPAYDFEGVPNRDSLLYGSIYGIESAETILRGTLRFKGFCETMQAIKDLGLLSEEPSDFLSSAPSSPSWSEFMAHLSSAVAGSDPASSAAELLRDASASPEHAAKMVDNLSQMGLLSKAPVGGQVAPIDALCDILKERLSYGPGERDLIVLVHLFDIEWADGRKERRKISLVQEGEPDGDTAMALTVGTPCAIASDLVLSGDVSARGVLRPVTRDIYGPMLERLEDMGISFTVESEFF